VFAFKINLNIQQEPFWTSQIQQKPFGGRGSAPDPAGARGSLQCCSDPRSWWEWAASPGVCPLPKNSTPAFGPSGLRLRPFWPCYSPA